MESPLFKENFGPARVGYASAAVLISWLHADCFGSLLAHVLVLLKDSWVVLVVFLPDVSILCTT